MHARVLLARHERQDQCRTVFCRSASALPAHAPCAQGASRAPNIYFTGSRCRLQDAAGHVMKSLTKSRLGKEMISLSPPPRRTVRTSHLVHGSSNLRTPKG